jgi:hypothetical protein
MAGVRSVVLVTLELEFVLSQFGNINQGIPQNTVFEI